MPGDPLECDPWVGVVLDDAHAAERLPVPVHAAVGHHDRRDAVPGGGVDQVPVDARTAIGTAVALVGVLIITLRRNRAMPDAPVVRTDAP